MPNQPFDHQSLDNLMRGVEDLDPMESSAHIAEDLKQRGIDAPKIASSIKSRIREKLRQRKLDREQHKEAAKSVEQCPYAWTHRSIKLFAEDKDPVEKVIALANSWALQACEDHLQGGIIDPFIVAKWRSIPVYPRDDIADARTVSSENGKLQIEYNPHRPKARTRFSIAHELAHTFFPDCGEMIRNRASRPEMSGDDWQLEMLCNLGAAELLMPIATFPEIKQEEISIDQMLELRKRYQVGVESLLLRFIRLTASQCGVFVASYREAGDETGRYGLDYILGSRSWHPRLKSGDWLPVDTVINQCKTIGFTAKGDEHWQHASERLHIECVGIPPFPGHRYPRVAGIVVGNRSGKVPASKLTEIFGNALEPRGSGKKILAYIVNDKTSNWGAGFAKAVATKWPAAQDDFREWVSTNRKNLRLGATFKHGGDDLWLFPMVCQHGYGTSATPRIRYGALKECLDALAEFAIHEQATVHMPKLGSGYAKGLWPIISQIIDETLCFRGVQATIYNRPGAKPEQLPELPGLFERREK